MKKKIQIVVGLLLGVFLVWFLFKDTNWPNVRAAIAGANKVWLAVSFTAVVLSFFTRVQRWSYIVRTAKPVSFKTLFNATQIGFLANYTLPARAGEVFRAVVLSRRAELPFTKCMAFVALDRVTDFFGLLAVLIITIVAFHPTQAIVFPQGMELPDWARPLAQPEKIRLGAELTGVLLAGVVGVLVVLYLNQNLALRISDAIFGVVSKKLAATVNQLMRHFAEGLHVFRSARDMFLSISWSLATWALAAVCFHALIFAFHLDAPWYASCLMLAMLSVAISLPGAPGFIGQYQIGLMLPLVIIVPGIPVDVAKAIAILGHLINLVAVAIAGVYALRAEHEAFTSLRLETAEAKQHPDEAQHL